MPSDHFAIRMWCILLLHIFRTLPSTEDLIHEHFGRRQLGKCFGALEDDFFGLGDLAAVAVAGSGIPSLSGPFLFVIVLVPYASITQKVGGSLVCW